MKKIFVTFISLLLICCTDNANADSQSPGGEAETVKSVVEDEVYETLSYKDADVTVKGVSSLILKGSADNVLVNSTVYLEGGDAWLFFTNVDIDKFKASDLINKIKIDSKAIEEGVNVDFIKYYNGFYIKPRVEDYVPLYLYKDNDETAYPVSLDKVYAGSDIPVGDNAVARIMLKRGHMLVVSDNADGTGASKVFIAEKKNIDIVLDEDLKNKVSFMRTVPWSYVNKKGIGGAFPLRKEIGIAWHYRWGIQEDDASTFEHDYVPMFWGGVKEDGLNKIFQMELTNHVLAFNEPDGKEQANMTPEAALEKYPEILKLGLRTGSPACKEGQWKNWLAEFMEGCKQRNYRVDFIAIHWYDWGNWGNTQDPSPDNIDAMVNRLKNDIDNCYAKYGLPIWITEFNANTNRDTETQIRFLEKALPMLESHPHVERYAYFQPSKGTGDFLDDDGNLTDVAKTYGKVYSSPSYKQ